MRKKTRVAHIIILACMAVIFSAIGAAGSFSFDGMFSANYKMTGDTNSGGGTTSLSGSYKLPVGAIGQTVFGNSTSQAYKLNSGLVQLTTAQTTDGDVWCWGDNGWGQLGDGTYTDRYVPTKAINISGASCTSTGYRHTLAVKPNGGVYCWGINGDGQLGDGTTTSSNQPKQVPALTSGVISVSAGYYHSMALKSDGTVWTWGKNNLGQLGRTGDNKTPAQVPDLSGIIAISGGEYHSMALKNDGTVWTWGDNSSNQLGDGIYHGSNRTVPYQIPGFSGVKAISAGSHHSLAVKSDGTVWAWGTNMDGELGDTELNLYTVTVPSKVISLTGIVAVSAGNYHTVALKYNGTVWTCGSNSYGQLGRGGTGSFNYPAQVTSITDAISVAAGYEHTLVLRSDKTAWACGENNYGQIGDGTLTNRTEFTQTSGSGGYTALGGGEGQSVGLKTSLDLTPPTSFIGDPANGATLSGVTYSITGNASDLGGSGVQMVEVGVTPSGGSTAWYTATGTTSWSYTWTLPARGTYSLMSRATDDTSNTETPVSSVTVTISPYGNSELQHYNWDGSMTGNASCNYCHVANNKFLAAGYRKDNPAFCYSCHNAASVGHEELAAGKHKHPTMVNVTSYGSDRLPTYGNITAGEYNNEPFSRLKGGKTIVCATCHNGMRKYEDYGRTWELTTSSDRLTYTLQRGGWTSYGKLVLKVYRDTTLWGSGGPTYSRTKKSYLVNPSEYTYDETGGTVTFGAQQSSSVYIYVSLDYPYLRASSQDNRLCSDCHTEATHKSTNCLSCHQSHNTDNLAGIRGKVRTTDRTERAVKFLNNTGTNSMADGDTTYDGICEVCHTQTLYFKRDGSGSATHADSMNYNGKRCTGCHSHASGFAR